ncbi:MAG: aminoacyl-tRNA hydrolase [Patescibacteria group bacterium]|nr:aminoacyl-tRNA hydrolase [Patescibacteria group bacterium]
MKLIAGLGNPGKKYEKTRHNLGFMVVDKLAQDLNAGFKIESKFKSDICETEYNEDKIILAKPLTYMNNSGQAASLISGYFNILPSDIWVIHDDVDFPLGIIKIKFGGVSAGHNGVESVIESLGTEKFWRFRMGIGRTTQVQSYEVEDYVLQEFRPEEGKEVQKVIKKGAEAFRFALDRGMDAAMNQYNSQ